MNRSNTRAMLSLSALTLLITGAVLYAGPLAPPAGPVASTYKTLTEVEPRIAINDTNTPGDADSLFKITTPGSYYLTDNITGVAAKHGIEIAASGVTLDLNGFDLAGVPAMGAFDGVSATVANLTNIAVVNGSVRNWGQDGINLGDFSAIGCRVEGVQANGNIRMGVYVGTGSHASACSASGGQYGVFALSASTLAACSATGTTAQGLTVESGGTLSNCTAHDCTGTAINASFGCTITNCTAYQNTGIGIRVGNGCTLSNCSVFQNTVTGISAGNGCTLSNCSALASGTTGINTGHGCSLSGCVAYGGDGDGIHVGPGSTIEGCTARLNALDGIECSSLCVIRGNTCAGNGDGGDGAGIHATSTDNRIEGNHCSGADRGIDVDVAGNIIIRNTCSGNTTDWTIVADNIYGAIIDRRVPGSVAVNGFNAANTVGSVDPGANFSY